MSVSSSPRATISYAAFKKMIDVLSSYSS